MYAKYSATYTVLAVPTLVRELNDDCVLSVKMILYSVQTGCIACTYSEKGYFLLEKETKRGKMEGVDEAK